MAEYEYKGPHPVAGDAGELVHPGDVREFGDPPDCPPWELIEEEAPAPPPPPPPPAAPTPATKPATGTEGGM